MKHNNFCYHLAYDIKLARLVALAPICWKLLIISHPPNIPYSYYSSEKRGIFPLVHAHSCTRNRESMNIWYTFFFPSKKYPSGPIISRSISGNLLQDGAPQLAKLV